MTLNRYISELLFANVKKKKDEYDIAQKEYTDFLCSWTIAGNSEELWLKMRKSLDEYREALRFYNQFIKEKKLGRVNEQGYAKS